MASKGMTRREVVQGNDNSSRVVTETAAFTASEQVHAGRTTLLSLLAGFTVTLPPATPGREVTIINNGAETLQIFPASGDNLGTGVNLSTQLEPNESVEYIAFDSTNWHIEASTEILHAEMHDEDNGDAFIVTDAGTEFQSYHTNGLTSGDLAGWTFDAGGAGTSFPIASIADSPASGGVQAQITTTGSHLLAAGDIVSLSNMSAGTNAGIHIVLAPVAATTFEITSTNSTTATGTMDQAATLIAGTGVSGTYQFGYHFAGTPVGANETFDFVLYNNATTVLGSKARIQFGAGAKFAAFSWGGLFDVTDGDKISFAFSNEDSAANITIRDFNITLVRL